jgi:hypothetical protein
MSLSEPGIADSASQTLNRSGRTRAFDLRDPKRVIVTGPGGPTMVINEWLEFPASLKNLEKAWTDLDWLYFHETNDAWYYRMTREDLARANMSLDKFLRPIYVKLLSITDYEALRSAVPRLRAEAAAVKVLVAERIADPKQLRDLLVVWQ